jgi:hypothetical protein
VSRGIRTSNLDEAAERRNIGLAGVQVAPLRGYWNREWRRTHGSRHGIRTSNLDEAAERRNIGLAGVQVAPLRGYWNREWRRTHGSRHGLENFRRPAALTYDSRVRGLTPPAFAGFLESVSNDPLGSLRYTTRFMLSLAPRTPYYTFCRIIINALVLTRVEWRRKNDHS